MTDGGRDCEVTGWLGGGDMWWRLQEQEVLSVPLNLESGQGEQTGGERAY